MRRRHRLRALANWANLATPAGLLVAAVCCRGPVRRTRNGLWLAHGYRPAVPGARAFTLGSVVLLRAAPGRGVDPVGSVDPRLLAHEERNATQYACCGGIVMPLAYAAAAAWSWVYTGDPASANPFERHAGLAAGGYRGRGPRPVWTRVTQRGGPWDRPADRALVFCGLAHRALVFCAVPAAVRSRPVGG